jgi:L-fuculose-phosphate aldolase
MSRSAQTNDILNVCKQLHARDFLAGADGNVSFRISNSEILITPSGKHKGFITADDLAVITLENEIVSGHPSGEREMHLEIYRRVPRANCVVHAHPPTAIAWSVARPDLTELPSRALSETILAVGRVPIARYARPGTVDMAEAIRSLLPDNRVMILARHGALSWGESIEEAYNGMERIEAISRILKLAEELGGITSLPETEVAYLEKVRRQGDGRTL